MSQVVLLDNRPSVSRSRLALGLAPLVIFGALPVWGLLTDVRLASAEWIVMAAWGTASILAVWVALVHIYFTELIFIQDGILHGERRIGRWRWVWDLPLTGIRELRIPGRGREHMHWSWGIGIPALVVKGDAVAHRCCFAVRPSQAEAIADKIRAIAGAA